MESTWKHDSRRSFTHGDELSSPKAPDTTSLSDRPNEAEGGSHLRHEEPVTFTLSCYPIKAVRPLVARLARPGQYFPDRTAMHDR